MITLNFPFVDRNKYPSIDFMGKNTGNLLSYLLVPTIYSYITNPKERPSELNSNRIAVHDFKEYPDDLVKVLDKYNIKYLIKPSKYFKYSVYIDLYTLTKI